MTDPVAPTVPVGDNLDQPLRRDAVAPSMVDVSGYFEGINKQLMEAKGAVFIKLEAATTQPQVDELVLAYQKTGWTVYGAFEIDVTSRATVPYLRFLP